MEIVDIVYTLLIFTHSALYLQSAGIAEDRSGVRKVSQHLLILIREKF